MSHPKDPRKQSTPSLGRLQALKKLRADARSLAHLENSSNASWKSTISNARRYSSVTLVCADRLIIQLRQRLPSLPVDQGLYRSSRIGASERWWRLGTLQANRFSVSLVLRSYESDPEDQPRTSLTFELSVRSTRQQLSDKLTSSLRSLRTLGRLSHKPSPGPSQYTKC